jgi:sugar phosphate permease
LACLKVPAFPGNSKIAAAWFPTKERGTAAAIFNSPLILQPYSLLHLWAGLLQPFMAVYFLDYGWSWNHRIVYLAKGDL